MSDGQSLNVDDFRTAANEMRKAYGHHNAVCTLTDLLLRSLTKIELDAKVIAALKAQLRRIVDHYDMRSELYTSDAELAAGMADIARLDVIEQTAGET
jgi:hypothetical protein